ncbi:MAG: histidinol dehydrogenase [Thermoplasmata archaeon]
MDVRRKVFEILKDVREEGTEAVRRYSKKFDDYDGKLKVEDMSPGQEIPEEDKHVIEEIIDRVFRYHRRQLENDELYTERGSIYGMLHRPVQRAGLYVPGGEPLPSSLIMSGVPAKIAGVEDVAVVTPPMDGEIDPYVSFVADSLGFDEIYRIGGAQAIGAMAYGAGMKKVDKIFGPGNEYVNEAKRQVFGDVGIDSLAGPSDVCIISDSSARVSYVLSDLESQLEHGVNSKAWLLTTSEELAEEARSRTDSEVFLFKDLNSCVEKSNEIAPEHLEIITEDPLGVLEGVKNAGAVYLGEYTPVAAADYFLGVNHILPTGGASRFSSVLTVKDFMKSMSVAYVGEDEFRDDCHLGIRLADIENMTSHKRSMEVRLDEKED